ncbi:MAG: response regulator [Flavobacteriales bacterium]
MKNPRIIIVDDHKIFGEGFCTLLESYNYRVLRVFNDAKSALNYIKKKNNIDIVFSDINMPNINGLDFLKQIKKFNSGIKVIMMSMYTDKNIINQALKNNVDGYLSKNCSIDDLKKTISNCFKKNIKLPKISSNNTDDISDVYLLKYKLTEREKEIIKHILDQKSNIEIAEELEISKRTVETHRKNIMLKLEVKNSIGIAVKCIENNILQTS